VHTEQIHGNIVLAAWDGKTDPRAWLCNMVEKHDPKVLALELDETSYAPLFDRKGWEDSLLKDHWGKESVFFSLMAQVMYVSFEELLEGEAKPKPHHLAAVELAGERKIALELADRRIDLTLKRAWYSLNGAEKLRMAGYFRKYLIGFASTKKPAEGKQARDAAALLENELFTICEKTRHAFREERYEYTVRRLTELSKRGPVLAIVSPEMLENLGPRLGRVEKTDTSDLEEIPPTSLVRKYYFLLVPICFIALLVYLLHDEDFGQVRRIMLYWFLIATALNLLGAIAAGAHWKSLLAVLGTTWALSWFLVGSGWIAGIVELAARQPRVGDIYELGRMPSLKTLFRNRALKPVWVGLAANVGNIIAVAIILPYILEVGL